jgi:hypothetical protein
MVCGPSIVVVVFLDIVVLIQLINQFAMSEFQCWIKVVKPRKTSGPRKIEA